LDVTVFAPDDLTLVKGGPQGRRDYLDDLLVAIQPRHDALRSDVERILRQRNALLKQAAGVSRPSPDVGATLDVWDHQLADRGEALAAAREGLVAALTPHVTSGYDRVAERSADVRLAYQRSWSGALAPALAAARADDLRRGVTTIGPHRDDLVVTIGSFPSRTHASQGEQRSVALALRLAGHSLVADSAGTRPVLLLDDVFSELDPERSEALVSALPGRQAILTSASGLPPLARPDLVVRIEDGKLLT
jgi:DNA replication and repair protein RecF